MPLHVGKGRTVAEALGRTTDYVKNPEKTKDGDLVTAYQCNPAIADQEFLFSKRQYAANNGFDIDSLVLPHIIEGNHHANHRPQKPDVWGIGITPLAGNTGSLSFLVFSCTTCSAPVP